MKNLYEITHPDSRRHRFVIAETYGEAVGKWMEEHDPKKIKNLSEPDSVVLVSREVIL